MSREQHRHRSRRCTLSFNPVAPIGLLYPHMGCFKFLAACHLLNFFQNHKSRNRGSCFEFMAPFTRSKVKPVRTIEPGKKRKRPGLWKKKKKTDVMEQIGKELEDANRLQSDDKDMSSKCELCEVLVAKDLFVIHCQHQFCRECLEKQISQLMALKAEDFTLARAFPTITCPLSRCNVELSELELVELVGKERAVEYISRLLSHYDWLYQPILNKDMRMFCRNSTCDRNTPSAISASYISQLNNSEVQQALMARGLAIKQKLSSKHKLLLDFIGWNKRSNTTSWICTTCNAAWCGTCGLSLPMTERTTDSEFHLECDRQSLFELYSQLFEMRDVFEAFTCGKDSQKQRKEVVFKSSGSESQKTVWARGTGFGGGATSKSQIDSWQTASRRAELDFDKRIEKALGYLAEILEEEATKDGESPALGLTVSSLFTWRNILPRVLVHLASNDSMLDITERKGLYFKMVSLINAICLHKELIPLVIKTESSSDETLSKNLHSRSALLNKMRNIYSQSKIMLHHSSRAADTENLDISLAGALFKCYENLQNFVELHSKGVVMNDVETGLEMKQLVSAYIGKLKSLQFRLVSMADQDGNYRHYFKNHIEGNLPGSTSIDNGGAHNHKRMLHISKEIASLATTLPIEWESSIHVCVDEKRMDVLRALIIGPHRTPYQNGIFIFDIFLPPDYPQQPPQVQFLTTGGGTVRFNPNLYDSGKVCLSLLGTWNGPGWIPGKSTLLQVLVSIQSLIFVSNPYYNEPGYERAESNNAEIENTRHRENTLTLAILGALRKPEVMFTELILEHFRYKCQEVEQQCNEWVESASNPTVKSRMEYTARGIKAELKALKRMR